MPDEKKTPADEVKWWIERGPLKEQEKKPPPQPQGLIERWTYELLKDYRQEQALQNVVDINQRVFKELSPSPGEWGYLSLGVGKYPAGRLARIKEALKLPPRARALAIDAGYSVRILVTGEPVGERVVDINFTEAPSLDCWIHQELVEERLFSSLDEALKELKTWLRRYLGAAD